MRCLKIVVPFLILVACGDNQTTPPGDALKPHPLFLGVDALRSFEQLTQLTGDAHALPQDRRALFDPRRLRRQPDHATGRRSEATPALPGCGCPSVLRTA